MILRNVLKNASFLVILFITSSRQVITEVDVPELLLLASHLKPDECVKLVSIDVQHKLAGEQDCFLRLVKWICQLRIITRNTYPVLKDRLKNIGREDLIDCLVESDGTNSNSPKRVREVQSVDDSEDYEGVTTVAVTTEAAKKKDVQNPETKSKAGSVSNNTIEKINGQTAIKISLKAAGMVILTSIILTCCCTLFIRNRLAKLFNKFRRKKKGNKFEPVDKEERRSLKKAHKKRKRAPSYDMVHTGTQNVAPVVAREPQEPPVTGCCKCYKTKRKKTGKRPHR